MPVAHLIKARNDRRFFRKLHAEMGVTVKGRKRKIMGRVLAAGIATSLAGWQVLGRK